MHEFLIPDPVRIKQYTDYMNFSGEILEIGTGSGILAKIALEKGAKSVTAVDINPYAVENAKKLAPNAQVFESDLFSAVHGCFDQIIFAAPWSEGEIKTPRDFALYDNGVVKKFLEEAGEYLNLNGAVWLQYCDAFPNNFNQLENWIEAGSFNIQKQWSYVTWGQLVKRNVNVILYKLIYKPHLS